MCRGPETAGRRGRKTPPGTKRERSTPRENTDFRHRAGNHRSRPRAHSPGPRRALRHDVARHVGLHLDNWTVAMPDGRHWTVESDASVTDPDAEVVSPVCRWEDIPMVQEVVRALRRAGAHDRRILRHPHPCRAGRAHPAKPAQAGQHRQRQGRPADHGPGHHRPERREPLVPARRATLPRSSSTSASPPPWRPWHGSGTPHNGGGEAQTGGSAPRDTTTAAATTCSTFTRPFPPSAPRTPSSSAPSTAHCTRAR